MSTYAPSRPAPSVWRAGRPRRRVRALQIGIVVLFAGVLVRVAYTQTVDPDGYSAQGLRQRLESDVIPAARGSILDRRGQELALSIPQSTLWADPAEITDPVGTATRVAAVLDAVPGRTPLDVAGLAARLGEPGSRFAYVARQLDDGAAAAVEALDLPGVHRREEARRFAPAGSLAQSIVGATDLDGNGTAGLEQLYDDLLTGTPGEIVRERAPGDRTFPSGQRQETAPVPGQDLVLTLDRTIQYETEQIMLRAVEAAGAQGGMAVLMDPTSGDIYAMANVERAADGTVELSKANKALVDVFEPGSVNKMITMAAAVQDGVTSPDTGWAVPEVLVVDDHPFRDTHPDPDGQMTAREIMTESSNLGTYLIAERLGPQRLYDYFGAFGLTERTTIGFPGESAGLLAPPDEWYGTNQVTIPYGQGVAVTAVQMLGAYNAIANGGTYVPPRLVSAVVDADGVRHDAPVPEGRAVVSPETAASITSMLGDVVGTEAGTGGRAAIAGYTVAGKTGTAKKPQGPTGYLDAAGRAHYMQVFAGFAPVEQPRFAALVVLDESRPPGVAEIDEEDVAFAGEVAAPVFAELGAMALRQLQVPPTAAIPPAPAAASGGMIPLDVVDGRPPDAAAPPKPTGSP